MELQNRLARLLEAHPQLAYLWLLILGAVVVAVVAMVDMLRRRRRRGEVLWGRVQALKIPDSDGLLLLFILTCLMILPVGSWFFPAVAICGVIWLLRRQGFNLGERWGAGRLSWPQLIGLVLWIYLVVMGLLLPVSWVMDRLALKFHWDTTPQFAVELLLQSGNPWRIGWLLFLAVVLAPAAEEILFRGFLYPWLKGKLPALSAWLLTAAIFAAIHFHAMTFPQLFVLGLVLAAAYEVTGSLALCVGLHMCFNFVSAGVLLVIKYATA